MQLPSILHGELFTINGHHCAAELNVLGDQNTSLYVPILKFLQGCRLKRHSFYPRLAKDDSKLVHIEGNIYSHQCVTLNIPLKNSSVEYNVTIATHPIHMIDSSIVLDEEHQLIALCVDVSYQEKAKNFTEYESRDLTQLEFFCIAVYFPSILSIVRPLELKPNQVLWSLENNKMSSRVTYAKEAIDNSLLIHHSYLFVLEISQLLCPHFPVILV